MDKKVKNVDTVSTKKLLNNKTIEYIKSYLFRYYGKNNFLTFIKAYLRNKTFRFQCAFRMCNGKGLSKYIGILLLL